jgi:hypothetical protein
LDSHTTNDSIDEEWMKFKLILGKADSECLGKRTRHGRNKALYVSDTET